jgi:hypothetical protein
VLTSDKEKGSLPLYACSNSGSDAIAKGYYGITWLKMGWKCVGELLTGGYLRIEKRGRVERNKYWSSSLAGSSTIILF